MNFDFELILFYATVITGIIALFDMIYLTPRRKRHKTDAVAITGYLSLFDLPFRGQKVLKLKGDQQYTPIIIEYARSFFPILLIVFLLRSFLYEPFRIPSGSLEPTLLMGDFILVNKYDYGMRVPVIHKRIMGEGKPERGDIVVFRWPPNPSVNFIKRVIGLPGDKISYINKELFVNGQKVPQELIEQSIALDEKGTEWQAITKQEDLLGIKHKIYVDPKESRRDYQDIVVPDNMYFVMGDNRDHSADSRFWGFVPDNHIVGKAVLVWMSWDGAQNWSQWIRWKRIGKSIH